MKIAFDHQIFSIQSFGGVSRYAVRLAEHLGQHGHDARIFAPLHINQFLDDFAAQRGSIRLPFFPPEAAPLLLATNRTILKLRNRQTWRPDLVHETYYTDRPVNLGGTKVVVTVYDMIHERMPECFRPQDGTTRRKKSSIRRADHLIAISKSAKNDLCDLFDVSPDKVSVVYLGFDPLPYPTSTVATEKGRPFLLYVGQRHGYKNFRGLLRAVGSRPALRSAYDILAFGGRPFGREERQAAVDAGVRVDGLHHLGGNDAVLAACYRSAAAFVYPSLYEGFGLPPLEAMSCECPVISSNAASLPEVIGDAAEFFDPNDPDSIAHAVDTVLSDQDRQRQLVQVGLRRLQFFSWDQCARETSAAYEVALAHR
ncbi:glycosyltransferase family 1 protein [Variovorax sp. dw_308]|uniref:glycosyltransferase family 4 protein n=1 Tax=Variovorax sp. dw_308 TaxID=2721546 RepID=UPI001C49164D|nr:glycosyltransferase family 1 protein [Variovorax sp. dw_308]